MTHQRSVAYPKGFTLIELLVVIAVIAILSVLGVVQLRTAREKARDTARRHDLVQTVNALALYFDSNGAAFPLLADLVGFSADHSSSSTLGASTGVFANNGPLIPRHMSWELIDPSSSQGGHEYFYVANCDTASCTGATGATDYILYTLLETEPFYFAVGPQGKLADVDNGYTNPPTCPQEDLPCTPPT